MVLKAHRNMGRSDALALREKVIAGTITDSELINMEAAIPEWDPNKDYSGLPDGIPIKRNGQVYTLDKGNRNMDTPSETSGSWKLKHRR